MDRGMDELIAALQLLAKYDKPTWPTHCEHDTLYVLVDPGLVSDEDKKRLGDMGFIPGSEEDAECFFSFRYGSA